MDNKAIQPITHSGRLGVSSRRSTTSRSKAGSRHGNVDIWNSLLAGSMAGTTSAGLFYPLDVLRTKMQSSVASHGKNASAKRRRPQDIFRKTVKHGGGFRALYTGLSLPLCAQAMYKATVYTVNLTAQTLLMDYKGEGYQLTLQDQFLCGAMGGAVNGAIFVTPVEFVRNQLIAQHTKFTQTAIRDGGTTSALSRVSGPLHVIRTTVSQEGVAGLWRGATITIARDSLGCGSFFFMFHSCQRLLRQEGDPNNNFGITLISGAAAGLGFWSVALPLDTLKTVIQTGKASSSARAVINESLTSLGPWNTMKRFTRGWQFALGRGAPAAAVSLGTYEMCYRALDSRIDNDM